MFDRETGGFAGLYVWWAGRVLAVYSFTGWEFQWDYCDQFAIRSLPKLSGAQLGLILEEVDLVRAAGGGGPSMVDVVVVCVASALEKRLYDRLYIGPVGSAL